MAEPATINKPSFIDLSHLSGAVLKLTSMYGIDYKEIANLGTGPIPEKYQLATLSGTFYTQGIFKSGEIAVAKSFASAGSKIQCHTHKEWEIVYVIEGELDMEIDGEVQHYGPGQLVVLSPDAPHEASFPIESVLLCITIPASESWPNPLTNH